MHAAIETGLPIVQGRIGNFARSITSVRALIEELQPGQSRWFEGKKPNAISSVAWFVAKEHEGRKFTTGHVTKDNIPAARANGAAVGTRVWRTA